MADKFQNKYRIPSSRLQTWDYGSNGMYFITICTHNRKHYFGEIVNGQMQLSEMGLIFEKYWNEIPEHFQFVKLDEFITMPNHVHGIIIIDKVQTRLIASLPTTDEKTHLIASLPEKSTKNISGGITGGTNPMFHDNISRIIRWYKGRCTFEIRKLDTKFR